MLSNYLIASRLFFTLSQDKKVMIQNGRNILEMTYSRVIIFVVERWNWARHIEKLFNLLKLKTQESRTFYEHISNKLE
jgi:hypothetical protein